MNTESKNVSAKKVNASEGVNLAPGYAVLLVAAGITATGFHAGVPLFPFGGFAIAGCLFGAVQIPRLRQVSPGYTSFLVALFAMAAAVLMGLPH